MVVDPQTWIGIPFLLKLIEFHAGSLLTIHNASYCKAPARNFLALVSCAAEWWDLLVLCAITGASNNLGS